jgi:PAS domain S-box-containing protein
MEHLLKELRSTLAKMELALGTVDEGIVWTNQQGLILWCNAVFDRLVMRPHIFVLAHPITEILPLLMEDDQSPCQHHPFQRAISSRVKGRQHYYFLQGEQLKFLEVTWAYFQEWVETREERGCVLTIRDMTAWQQQNVALQQAQIELVRVGQVNKGLTLLEKILENALAGYWDWNIITGEEYLSPGFKRMFGYQDHELPNLATTWEKLIFIEDRAKIDQSFADHVSSRGQSPFYAEVRYHHKNGSTVWVICTGQVIRWDKDGNPLRAIGCHVDITLQKQSEERLRASLKEKEILIKEIHHRVKNNLLIVSSLLNWQGEDLQESMLLRSLADSQKRINSMALIHEKLYGSTDLVHIDFGDYLQTLATQIVDSFCSNPHSIKIHYHLTSIPIGVETATPCGLIINELLLNTLEHAFPHQRPGNIIIVLRRDATGEMTIIIKDDGVGLPCNFNFRNAKSLGWQLICLLTEQLEGQIQVISPPGTEVILKFHELQYAPRL